MTDNVLEGYPFPCFSYDMNKSVVLNTGYIMSSNTVDLMYILGILNSSLGRFLVKLYVTQLQQRQFRMLAQSVSLFPIPLIDEQSQIPLIKLVSSQLKHQTPENDYEINKAVYTLYCLNDQEIEFIKNRMD